MKKILLTIQYNGSAFSGWQKQKNQTTVQGVLEEQISSLLGEEIELFASGRTDSGVHAIAQTAHFETASNFPLEKLVKAINHGLNENVSVLSAKQVNQNFHAQFSVKKKTYLYKVYPSAIKLPLLETCAAQVHENIAENLEVMKRAASLLEGTHNFKSFCSAQAEVQNFERTIYKIKIKKAGPVIEFYVTGSGFLYNMVRILAGTLISVAEGKILLEQIPEILAAQNRTKNPAKTMPPKSLYLYKVKY